MELEMTKPLPEQPKTRAQKAAETRARRLAEALAAKQAQDERERQEYPKLLMSALARASKLGWRIAVLPASENSDSFVFAVRNHNEEYRLPFEFINQWTSWDLDGMTHDMTVAEERIREEQQRHDLRNSALNKLSEEERKALGL